MPLLQYGNGAELDLEVDPDALIAICDAPRGEPLADVRSAVARALDQPLGYPPLAQAAVAGDRVVLALNRGVPQAPAIVAETIESLLAVGVSPADITLVRTSEDAQAGTDDPLGLVPDEARGQIIVDTHDPRDRDALSYLAASADGLPIYLNRAIFDADLVISIDVLRLPDSLGYHGTNAGLFPAFSDAASLARFRSTKSHQREERAQLRQEADEVAWLLGSRFTIQVVPGANQQVLAVLAGDAAAVATAGSRACDEAWSYQVPRRAAVVVGTLVGDASQQTWENAARALAACSLAAAAEGDIILCTQLAEDPGPALQRLIGEDDAEIALREIAREKPADAPIAAELVRVLERSKVFLVSELAEDLVENLGLVPLSADSVSHVAGRYDSCIVLSSAQYAEARTSGKSSLAARVARRSR